MARAHLLVLDGDVYTVSVWRDLATGTYRAVLAEDPQEAQGEGWTPRDAIRDHGD